jgi:hypothetical protein
MNGWKDWLKLFGAMAAACGFIGRLIVALGIVYSLAVGANATTLVAIGMVFLLLEVPVKTAPPPGDKR